VADRPNDIGWVGVADVHQGKILRLAPPGSGWAEELAALNCARRIFDAFLGVDERGQCWGLVLTPAGSNVQKCLGWALGLNHLLMFELLNLLVNGAHAA